MTAINDGSIHRKINCLHTYETDIIYGAHLHVDCHKEGNRRTPTFHRSVTHSLSLTFPFIPAATCEDLDGDRSVSTYAQTTFAGLERCLTLSSVVLDQSSTCKETSSQSQSSIKMQVGTGGCECWPNLDRSRDLPESSPPRLSLPSRPRFSCFQQRMTMMWSILKEERYYVYYGIYINFGS